eukprot:214640_1
MSKWCWLVYCFIFVRTCNSQTRFDCDNGNSIYQFHLCDGFDNCGDSSDETVSVCAGYNCTNSQFQCDYGACINERYVCDGESHCVDASDETLNLCGNNTCYNNQFQCAYGACIEEYRVCHGNKNCIDGSDENPSVCSQYSCSHGMIKCADDSTRCIQGEKCDLSHDCDDGSDELNCNSYKCEYVFKSLNKSVLMN